MTMYILYMIQTNNTGPYRRRLRLSESMIKSWLARQRRRAARRKVMVSTPLTKKFDRFHKVPYPGRRMTRHAFKQLVSDTHNIECGRPPTYGCVCN